MIETNLIRMRLQRIEPETFVMGGSSTPLPIELTDDPPHRRHGDFDKHPAHKVAISNPFYMGAFEVTNVQYEQFATDHRSLRGKLDLSQSDDEAVVFVSWHDAMRLCRW